MNTIKHTQSQHTPTALPILTAPTASGKSALALALARQYPLEIISADAFTIYQGLDIGTAKPTLAERQAVAHHLLDIAHVSENYDVARWLRAAEHSIAAILERRHIPLIVGGTGFYLQALIRGLPLAPPSEPSKRAELEAELATRGLDALLADIAAHDPREAARMARNPQRILRATEVFRASGQYPGAFGYATPRYRYRVFTLHPVDLSHRIAMRVGEMLNTGWPDEAAWLAQQVSPQAQPRPTAWQALGYPEALAVAQGALDQAEAAAQITLKTRQYAKRQQTWIRTQLGNVEDAQELSTWLEGW